MTIEVVIAGTNQILDFPDDTSREDIRTALRSIFRIEEAPQQDFAQQLASEVGPFEAVAIGAGRGLTTIARGLGIAEPEDPATAQAIAALKEQRPITTGGGEILGEAAPFLIPGAPLGAIVGTGARALATGLLGVTEGTLIARGQDAGTGEQILSGGVGGVAAGVAELVLPRLSRLGGSLIRRVLGQSPAGEVVAAAVVPSAELQSALKESGQTFDDLTQQVQRELQGDAVDPADAARKAFLESQG